MPNYARPWLVPEIEAAFFSADRIVLIEGATKTGKTTTAMAWLLEKALLEGKPGRQYWWVGSIYNTAKIAYRRYKNGLDRRLFDSNDADLCLTFPNGAQIRFRSAENPDSLFGEDVHAAVCDELTRWKEASFHAIRSTVTATGGEIRGLYNTKGRGHWAYVLSQKINQGETPSSSYHVFDIYVAVRAGIIPGSEVDEARALLPEQVFNELYLCIPSDDGGNPFGIRALEAITHEDLAAGPPICFGIDLGRAQDWTVVIGLNAQGEICTFDRWKSPLPWPQIEANVDALVGGVPALVESNGVGDRVLPALQALNRKTYEGWNNNSHSKQQAMEGLAVAIQKRKTSAPAGPIIDEAMVFEYVLTRTSVRYSAPQGFHDDCVMAWAIAWLHYQNRTGKRFLIDSERTAPDIFEMTI